MGYFNVSWPWNRWNAYTRFFILYVVALLLGVILLYCPFSSTEQNSAFSILDSVFTTASAFTNTGLSVVNTKTHFTFVGQLTIGFLMLLGGLGSLVVLTHIMDKTLGSRYNPQRDDVVFSMNKQEGQKKIGIIKFGSIFILGSLTVGIVILWSFFYFYQSPALGVWDSIWYGSFHAISAINNSGFDLLGENSLQSYTSGVSWILPITLCLLSMIGGVGFPIFYDVLTVRKKTHHTFTFFSKLSLISYFSVCLIGIILIILCEFVNNNNIFTQKTITSIFYALFARSSGFSTGPITDLSQQSQFLVASLMFIGVSPVALGGGIRSMIFFLLICKLCCMCRGGRSTSIFKRKISDDDMNNFWFIILTSLLLVSFIAFLIACQEVNKDMTKVMFEAFSAFGNVGLSHGISKSANKISKTLIIALMFLGHIGPTNILIPFANKKASFSMSKYPTEKIWIT